MSILTSGSSATNIKRRKIARDRRGAMLVFIAVTGIVMMGFLAMTLDVGAGSRQRRIAQTAADAGAVGGAQEILRVFPDSVIGSARNAAIKNGFVSSEITVNFPPASGTYTGNTQYVEVIISKNIPTIFGSIFNKSSLDVQARGVAGVSSSSLNCLYTLDPTGADALWLDGELYAPTCGVAVNSTSQNALWVKAGKDIVSPSTVVVGGMYGGGQVSPPAQTGTAPVANPLSSLVMPAVGPCDSTKTVKIVKNVTLNPGVYCGGFDIQNGNATLTLTAGTYIIAGGGIQIAKSGGIIGQGVTIINTNGPGNNTALFKPIDIVNSCSATLSAPTSGPFKDILFFQDPAAPAGAINTFSCAGTQTGSFYFPTQTIYFGNGNGKVDVVGTVIANSVRVKSGSTLTIISNPTGGSGGLRVSLVQ